MTRPSPCNDFNILSNRTRYMPTNELHTNCTAKGHERQRHQSSIHPLHIVIRKCITCQGKKKKDKAPKNERRNETNKEEKHECFGSRKQKIEKVNVCAVREQMKEHTTQIWIASKWIYFADGRIKCFYPFWNGI